MSTCDCTVISGPCGVHWGAYFFRSKGDVTITKETTLSPVTVDSFGVTDQRVNTVKHTISFTPSGMTSPVLAPSNDLNTIFARFATVGSEPQPGQSLFKWQTVNITAYASADAGAATTITIASTAGMVVGQYVTIAGSSTATYNGTWRIGAVTSSTQLKLEVAYTTDPTTDGTLSFSDALVIHPLFQSGGTEKIITFQNVALTTLPSLTFNATDTALGAVTFTAIYHRKLDSVDVDALVDYRAWSAPAAGLLDDFVPEAILTVPPLMRYGAASVNAWGPSDPVAAPWKSFCTANGATVNFSLGTAEHVVDTCGLVDIKCTDLNITVTAQPVGELMADEEIQKVLLQQDMGVNYEGRRRGQSMKAATPMELQVRIDSIDGAFDLVFPSTSVSAGGANYGITTMRNADLTWQALRTFSGGVRQPLFEIVTP
jgi:hypothetical protein